MMTSAQQQALVAVLLLIFGVSFLVASNEQHCVPNTCGTCCYGANDNGVCCDPAIYNGALRDPFASGRGTPTRPPTMQTTILRGLEEEVEEAEEHDASPSNRVTVLEAVTHKGRFQEQQVVMGTAERHESMTTCSASCLAGLTLGSNALGLLSGWTCICPLLAPVPNFSHQVYWKKSDGTYECITPANFVTINIGTRSAWTADAAAKCNDLGCTCIQITL